MGSVLGEKGIRFAVTILGLLILKAVVGALPMIKNASPMDDTLLSPAVLATAIVNTLIMLAILGFGLTVSRTFRRFYPRIPDLATAVLLLTVLLVLVLAYNLYEMPLASVLTSPQDLTTLGGSGSVDAYRAQLDPQLRNFVQQAFTGTLTPELIKNAAPSLWQAYQGLAVLKMRQSPDLYGWIFLLLAAIPTVGIVVIGSRNLDAISGLLFRKARTAGLPPGASNSGPYLHRSTAGPDGGQPGKELSSEDMDKLIRLKTLVDKGAITQADFDAQKRMILQGPVAPEEPAELQRLKQLLDAGALTQEEYDVQKQRILSRL
jgi:hypothetical protein